MGLPSPVKQPHVIGRYALFGEIAAGGMATVHYGRLVGPVGFSRTVAIKRLHAQFAKDPEFAAMFLDEARLAARIRHPNVVQTLDVVSLDGELFLVMDYVQGESLVRLLRACATKNQPVPLEVMSGIICGALHGLHSAHDATAEDGKPLGIVHRDVSPQNILIGADGVPRVLDFGVAKAAGRIQTTREGQLKGKLSYMSPEQIQSEDVDRRTDVYAMGVVLWETLTLQRLFAGEGDGAVIKKVLGGARQAPSELAAHVPKSVDEITLRALEGDPTKRYQTAREMALALEAAVPMASSTRIADWLERSVGDILAERARSVAEIESQSGVGRTGPASGVVPGESVDTQIDPLGSGRPPAIAGGSGSQASSASLSSTPRQAPSKRPPWALIAGAVVAVGVVAVLGGARITIGSRPAGSTTPSTPTTATPIPTPTPTPTPTAIPTATPTAIPTAATAASSPSATAAPLASVPAARPPPPKPLRPSTTKVKPASGGPDDSQCTIRSFVDESGIKRFVKECP